MDRRQQKSQKIIIDAFFELLKEKDIEKISMNQIAEKANVNRGTIYLNFTDKYELLRKCIETYFVDLILLCQHKNEALNKNILISIFEYLAYNFDMVKILFKNENFATFSSCMSHEIVNMLKKYFNSEITIQFLTSAILGVLIWWIKNSMPCAPNVVAEELWLLLEKNMPETAFDQK
ncbi:MAG: TetR/AcrR family transcriptional regulator [Mobilitalea sp.]